MMLKLEIENGRLQVLYELSLERLIARDPQSASKFDAGFFWKINLTSPDVRRLLHDDLTAVINEILRDAENSKLPEAA